MGPKLLLFLLAALFWGVSAPGHVVAQSRPNVILINMDDLDSELFETGTQTQVFPNLNRLASEGVRFNNCHVTSPLCGPSRASLLTGLYVHRHGVRIQEPGEKNSNGFAGGYPQFQSTVDLNQPSSAKPDWTRQDLGVAMKAAGYRTMLVGKYLHAGFQPTNGKEWKDLHPVGWDDFYCSVSGRYYDVWQYLGRRGPHPRNELRNTGELDLSTYANEDRPYLSSRYRTNIETIDAIGLIQQHTAESQQPFFLYFAPFAPHRTNQQSMIDERYQNWWPNLLQPHASDFNATGNGGKPEWLQSIGSLTTAEVEDSDRQYRERLLAMKSFDDMLGVLLERLQRMGVLEETIIVFTSDNGYMLGQQRHFGKQLPYDRCTQVPLVVWGPTTGVLQNQPRQHLVSHVDLFPTILRLAGQEAQGILDGEALNSLFLAGGSVPDSSGWRPEGVLCEHYQRLGHAWQDMEGVFVSLRLANERFTVWGDGLEEYYNLNEEPWEVDNHRGILKSGDVTFYNTLMRSALAFQGLTGSIGTPVEDGTLVFRGQTVSGYAIATEGVRQVRIVCSRINSTGKREYLDGQNWTTQYRQNLADLTRPDGMISRWSWDFQPEGQGTYPVTMTIRVYDNSGNYQQNVVHRSLMVEHDAPATVLDSHAAPFDWISDNEELTLSGWAKGNQSIREVRVIIKDTQTGRYFDGGQWRDEFRYVLARMEAPNGDSTYQLWSVAVPADQLADRIYVNARAYQIDNQYDTTIPWTVLHTR